MYYVGNIPCEPSDIRHWGVLGMKWGVRRYQNPDGTLTEAGKRRYGESGQYEYKSIGQKIAQRRLDKAVDKSKRHLNSMIAKDKNNPDAVTLQGTPGQFKKQMKLGDKAYKRNAALEAYKKRDADRLAYAKNTSVKKGIAQKVLLGGLDTMYQRSRARGNTRSQALLKTFGPMAIGSIVGSAAGMAIGRDFVSSSIYSSIGLGVGGFITRGMVMRENKQKYGHAMLT